MNNDHIKVVLHEQQIMLFKENLKEWQRHADDICSNRPQEAVSLKVLCQDGLETLDSLYETLQEIYLLL